MKIKLHESTLQQAKIAFSCRRVNFKKAEMLLREPYSPNAGDVVLARVAEIGHHKRIELATGRRALLDEGDLIVLAYGNRYAPDQFEGLVPHNLATCDMVAAGGIAANAISHNASIDFATRIEPLGVLADNNGHAINLMDFRLPSVTPSEKSSYPPVIFVAGTSMNAGKTYTVSCLVKGLTTLGYKVGATKLTGTGAGGDTWRMVDSGANKVLDFTDAGLATTYLASEEQLIDTAKLLLDNLAASNMDVIIAEIADGVGHGETCTLLKSSLIKSRASGVIFAAGDAMGASAGYEWLSRHELPVLAISGRLSAAPLALREAENLIPVPGFTAEQLCSPIDLSMILPQTLLNSTEVQLQPTQNINLPSTHISNGVSIEPKLMQTPLHTSIPQSA